MTAVIRSKKPNKYGAKKCEYDGHKFDSMAERDRYIILKMMQKQGKISSLIVHPKFDFSIGGRPVLIRSDGYPNGRQASFKPDFGYVKEGVGIVYEDTKGVITEAYRLRRALFEALYYPAIVIEITNGRKKPARWVRRKNKHRSTRKA